MIINATGADPISMDTKEGIDTVQLHRGDCLEVMKGIPDGSVDLALTDPPYGTMQGAAIDGWVRRGDQCDWDVAIKPADIFANCSRILRQNGKLILFSQEPYTSRLITEQAASLPFSYRAVWVKNVHANALLAKKAMVSRYEDVLIFQNKCPNKENCSATLAFQVALNKYGFDTIAELMFLEGRYKDTASARKNLSKKRANDFTELDYDNFFDEKMLRFLSERIELGFEPDWYLSEAAAYKRRYLPTFNLWQGSKSKCNVLEYAKDGGGYHPTQKPVALLEDLIQTFSNPGETVLDFTMGSGSTGVACVNTGRDFIGIELDEKYFGIAEHRIRDATAQTTLVV